MEANILLTEAQAAKILQAKPMTLNKWRCRRKGPPYLKLSGKVRYRMDDLTAFIESSRIVPTDRKATRGTSRRRLRRGSR